jgi:hypothetical protein
MGCILSSGYGGLTILSDSAAGEDEGYCYVVGQHGGFGGAMDNASVIGIAAMYGHARFQTTFIPKRSVRDEADIIANNRPLCIERYQNSYRVMHNTLAVQAVAEWILRAGANTHACITFLGLNMGRGLVRVSNGGGVRTCQQIIRRYMYVVL